jgi:serine/threonine protein phosphatase Stp1
MGFECLTRTHVGLRRKLNEDAVLDSGDAGIWAVADGMGGHDAGEVASAMVVEALSRLSPAASFDDLAEKAVTALHEANTALRDLARLEARDGTIGTTVVGLAIGDDRYRCFWAGDSRGYRVRDGRIAQLTRDHSLVQDLVDAGMIEADEAEGHPNANVVTRAVGATDVLRVDAVGGEVRGGDTFMLASDGLTRLVNEAELLAGLRGANLAKSADHFIELALARGAPDNVSFVIVRAG